MNEILEFIKRTDITLIYNENDLPSNIDFDKYAETMLGVDKVKDGFKLGLKEKSISYTDWVKEEDLEIPHEILTDSVKWGILKRDESGEYLIIPVETLAKIDKLAREVAIYTYSIDPKGCRWNHVNKLRFISLEEKDWIQLFFLLLNSVSIKVTGDGYVPELGCPKENTKFGIKDLSERLVKCFSLSIGRTIQVPWKAEDI